MENQSSFPGAEKARSRLGEANSSSNLSCRGREFGIAVGLGPIGFSNAESAIPGAEAARSRPGEANSSTNLSCRDREFGITVGLGPIGFSNAESAASVGSRIAIVLEVPVGASVGTGLAVGVEAGPNVDEAIGDGTIVGLDAWLQANPVRVTMIRMPRMDTDVFILIASPPGRGVIE